MLGMNTKHMDLTEWEYSEEEADFDNMEWFKVRLLVLLYLISHDTNDACWYAGSSP